MKTYYWLVIILCLSTLLTAMKKDDYSLKNFIQTAKECNTVYRYSRFLNNPAIVKTRRFKKQYPLFVCYWNMLNNEEKENRINMQRKLRFCRQTCKKYCPCLIL